MYVNQLGQLVPVGIIATSVGKVGVTAYHAAKSAKLQKGFQKKLDSDEAKKEYINFIVDRFESIGTRIAKGGRFRPGTKAFELVLKKALLDDMNYKGFCNADIYVPHVEGDAPKATRKVFASIDRTGHVSRGQVPPDVGPIWATGCRNAEDFFRLAFIDRYKGEKKHGFFKIFKEDLGSMDLFLRFGTGLLMLIAMVIVIKVQSAVVKEQRPKKKKKPASKY